MKTTRILSLMLAISFSIGSVQLSAAMTANQYKDVIGRGVSTSWFKGSGNNYNRQTLTDLKARGFHNVRIRTDASVHNTSSELNVLASVVDDCIAEGIVPIISWINHAAEDRGNNTDRTNYVNWWEDVAIKMAGKSDIIAFNLFTELGSSSPIRTDLSKYNDWTQRAVNAIRAVSPTRIIILSSPSKKSTGLSDISSSIYNNDNYMMAEWHLYASGPTQNGGQKNWEGNGSESDRENVTSIIDIAMSWTNNSGIYTYFGAWMPMDNINGDLNQSEVENFATFFLQQLSNAGIPWSANALDQYYEPDNNTWLSTNNIGGRNLNMTDIVDILVTVGDFGDGPGGTLTYTLTTGVVGSGYVSPSSGTYDEGTVVTLTATPGTGYEFSHWSGSVSGTTNPKNITMNNDKHVIANFTEVQIPTYTLSTNVIGNGSVSPSGGSYTEGTVVTLTATPATGWSFTGWSGDAGGTNTSTNITMNSNKSVTATFTEDGPGTEVTLGATDDSYIFSAGVNENYGTLTIMQVKKVSRKVGLVKFDLSSISGQITSATLELTNSSDNTGGEVSVYSITNDNWNESSVTYSNAPSKGSYLGSDNLGASGTVSSIDISNFVIGESSGDKVVSLWLNDRLDVGTRYDIATKEASGNIGPKLILQVGGGQTPTYTLITNVVGSGSVSPSGGTYDEGTVVTLSATPGTGYEFSHWSGSASGTANPINITMNSNKSVTANFTEVQVPTYTLTTNVVGSGSVSPSGGTYTEGTVVTLTATPASGWIFDHWSGNASGTNTSTSVTMNSNKNVTATFVEEPVGPITTTVTASDDAYVRNGDNRNNNYGSDPDLEIKQTGDASKKRYSYLQFDLSAIGTVTSAELKVKSVGNTDRDIDVYSTGDSWTEGSITWSNKPALGSVVATYVIGSNGNYTVDVTSYVAAQANGDNVASFALRGTSERLMTLSSKEGSYAPRLIIEHDGVPSKAEQMTLGGTEITAYPNPTSGMVTVKINSESFTCGTIRIVNTFGAIVEEVTIESTTHTLDLSNYTSGMYFLSVISQNNIELISTIIKQ